MVTLTTSGSEGTSYIIRVMTSSRMARRPRAPMPRSTARPATASRASGVNSRSTSSYSINFRYCFTREFLGSVRICTICSRPRDRSVVITGRRPTSSGMMPNFSRSWGWISLSSWPTSRSFLLWISAPKPMERLSRRLSMILSMPSKAPPQMNRMFFVSIWMNSWWGCFRPPWGGTLATVPSRIFSRACCTPSPDTSRVMEVFSLFRAILSISSI